MTNDIEEIIEVRDYLVNNRIHAYKYNYSLDATVQNCDSYCSFIELSKDQKYLKIINRKPRTNVKYILEADPEKVQEEKMLER